MLIFFVSSRTFEPMKYFLTILGGIILGVVSNAAWDFCKSIYRKRDDHQLTLLNLFGGNQIQTLNLSSANTKNFSINGTKKEKELRGILLSLLLMGSTILSLKKI